MIRPRVTGPINLMACLIKSSHYSTLHCVSLLILVRASEERRMLLCLGTNPCQVMPIHFSWPFENVFCLKQPLETCVAL